MTATVDSFRATFKAFDDETRFPGPIIRFYLELACLMLPAARWGNLLDYGSQLFAAHHLALEDKAEKDAALGGTPGLGIGLVSSKSAGPVSLSIDVNVGSEQGAGFWNLSIYGLRFYRLIRVVGMGGIQLGAPTCPSIMRVSQQQRDELIGFVNAPIFEEADSIPPAPVDGDC